jgi:hypothetical protein
MAQTAGEDIPDLALGDARYDSFVVRILSRDATGDVAYGRITHVGSRKSLAFRTMEELLAFMRCQMSNGDADTPVQPTMPSGRA